MYASFRTTDLDLTPEVIDKETNKQPILSCIYLFTLLITDGRDENQFRLDLFVIITLVFVIIVVFLLVIGTQ